MILQLLDKNRKQLAELENYLGYQFTDPTLLLQALIHRSYSFEQGRNMAKDNETLEFLGDAVLDLTVGYVLFKMYPLMREGELTRLRSALVKESHLAIMARELDLGSHLLLGKGEDASRGREKPSILSCAFEAVMGAIFLDGGYEAATAVVDRFVVPWIKKRKETLRNADAKSLLQEMIQEKFNEGPVYVLEKAEGPDHDKIFTVSVCFRKIRMAQGRAKNKKEAEQKAAAEAIENFTDFDFGDQ
jgi:ribonuclease-3